MNYSLLLEVIIFVSLGAMVLILARALPRVEDESMAARRERKLGEKSAILPLEKIDAAINVFLHKTLRKLKVFVMKIDNAISDKLRSFNKKETAPKALPEKTDSQ